MRLNLRKTALSFLVILCGLCDTRVGSNALLRSILLVYRIIVKLLTHVSLIKTGMLNWVAFKFYV